MRKNYKALIIGVSLTGKSTLIRYLRKTNASFPVQEIDEELERLNGGSYPKDDTYKNTILAPQIKNEILNKENILFFTNAHYFTFEDLEKARSKGFKIIQLSLDKVELERRNTYRMAHEGYEDHSHWLDAMLAYQKEISEKGLVDTVIETNKSVEKIAEEFLTSL